MSLAKSSLFFAAGTFLSRVVGLLREMVLATAFGATTLLDSFLIANRIPGLLRDLVAEGALGASFTKVFTELWEKDPTRAKLLARETCFFVGVIFGLVVIGLILAAGPIVSLFTLYAPSAYAESLVNQATTLTRLLLPYILLMSLSSMFAGILHQRGRFFLTAVAPILASLGYILGATFFADGFVFFLDQSVDTLFADRRLLGLAVGVLIGGAAQAGVQLFAIYKDVFVGVKRGSFFAISTELKRVLMLMGPMVIGASAGQISVLINTNFATSLGEGVVSQITLAFRLLHLPIGIFGVAISSAVLPTLTRQIARSGSLQDPTVGGELQRASELAVWLLAPCSLILVFLSKPLVGMLFGGGRFDEVAVQKTSEILSVYGIGVIGYGLTKIWSSFYYAIEKTHFPMVVSISNVAVGFLLNFTLVPKFGHLGLAATTAMIFLVNALILGIGILWVKVNLPRKAILKSSAAIIGAVGLSCTFLPFTYNLEHLRSTLPLKFFYALQIGVVSIGVIACFTGVACIRFQLTPKALLQLIRRRP